MSEHSHGWRRERREYWSEDPLQAWIGACPHAKCGCRFEQNLITRETDRSCTNADCPWDFMKHMPVEPMNSHVLDLSRRFSGLDFEK